MLDFKSWEKIIVVLKKSGSQLLDLSHFKDGQDC